MAVDPSQHLAHHSGLAPGEGIAGFPIEHHELDTHIEWLVIALTATTWCCPALRMPTTASLAVPMLAA
jgi:hypothetical protein